MPSNKKRRLEGLDSPKPISALSALAARRQAAHASPSAADTSTESETTPIISNTNPFSALKKTSNQNTPSKAASKALSKPNRQPRGTETPPSKPKAAGNSGGSESNSTAASPSAPKLIHYSSFQLTKRNHRIKPNGVVDLNLGERERFMVLGSFGIRIIRGEVTIAGATLRPTGDIQWVHAPHCHAIPVLRTTESSQIQLHPDPLTSGLRNLGRISPLFRKLWNEPRDGVAWSAPANTTFQILSTSEDAPRRSMAQQLESPPQWNKKIADLMTASRRKPSLLTLVCGPKSAGKSTFSRLLANRLITDPSRGGANVGVLFLDLDPGQPEFGLPGTLSLVQFDRPNLSPPFARAGLHDETFRVVRCHALAANSPALDPDLYLAIAKDLFMTSRRDKSPMPLIINTPGWILGTGLDLLAAIIQDTVPDEVLYLSEEGPVETVDVLQAASRSVFTELSSQQSEFTSRTAAHFRAMQTMAYFHQNTSRARSKAAEDTQYRVSWDPLPLTVKPPLLVRYSAPEPGIVGFLSYGYDPPSELLADAVAGTIVAVVAIEDHAALAQFSNHASLAVVGVEKPVPGDARLSPSLVAATADGIPFIPNPNDFALNPKFSRTVGLALVRGIDVAKKCLQLLSPIPLDTMEQIRSDGQGIVLVHGKFDAPTWAYSEDLYGQAEQEEWNDRRTEVEVEDTSDDEPVNAVEQATGCDNLNSFPWVEVLKGNEKRPVGSRVWRVRRDLGRGAGD